VSPAFVLEIQYCVVLEDFFLCYAGITVENQKLSTDG